MSGYEPPAWLRQSNRRARRRDYANRRYWEARRPDSPLRIELANVLKNIERDEQLLDSMRQRFLTVGGCCTPCMFGEAHSRTYKQLRRRVDRANQLLRKLHYDAGYYGPVRHFWSNEL